MPYQSIADLPDTVRDNVPRHAQEIYKEAFNSAFDDYKERGAEGREETAHKVAWSAVKKKYRKDEKSGSGSLPTDRAGCAYAAFSAVRRSYLAISSSGVSRQAGLNGMHATGHTCWHCGSSKWPTHSVHLLGSMT